MINLQSFKKCIQKTEKAFHHILGCQYKIHLKFWMKKERSQRVYKKIIIRKNENAYFQKGEGSRKKYQKRKGAIKPQIQSRTGTFTESTGIKQTNFKK